MTGTHDGRRIVHLTVSICELENGGVQSSHDFASKQDGETALKMESGGARQIAFALFSEALRRELFVDVLLQLKGDQGFLKTYQEAGEEEQREFEKILGEKAQRIMSRNLARMAPEAAREVLAMMVSGQGGTNG